MEVQIIFRSSGGATEITISPEGEEKEKLLRAAIAKSKTAKVEAEWDYTRDVHQSKKLKLVSITMNMDNQ